MPQAFPLTYGTTVDNDADLAASAIVPLPGFGGLTGWDANTDPYFSKYEKGTVVYVKASGRCVFILPGGASGKVAAIQATGSATAAAGAGINYVVAPPSAGLPGTVYPNVTSAFAQADTDGVSEAVALLWPNAAVYVEPAGAGIPVQDGRSIVALASPPGQGTTVGMATLNVGAAGGFLASGGAPVRVSMQGATLQHDGVAAVTIPGGGAYDGSQAVFDNVLGTTDTFPFLNNGSSGSDINFKRSELQNTDPTAISVSSPLSTVKVDDLTASGRVVADAVTGARLTCSQLVARSCDLGEHAINPVAAGTPCVLHRGQALGDTLILRRGLYTATAGATAVVAIDGVFLAGSCTMGAPQRTEDSDTAVPWMVNVIRQRSDTAPQGGLTTDLTPGADFDVPIADVVRVTPSAADKVGTMPAAGSDLRGRRMVVENPSTDATGNRLFSLIPNGAEQIDTNTSSQPLPVPPGCRVEFECERADAPATSRWRRVTPIRKPYTVAPPSAAVNDAFETIKDAYAQFKRDLVIFAMAPVFVLTLFPGLHDLTGLGTVTHAIQWAAAECAQPGSCQLSGNFALAVSSGESSSARGLRFRAAAGVPFTGTFSGASDFTGQQCLFETDADASGCSITTTSGSPWLQDCECKRNVGTPTTPGFRIEATNDSFARVENCRTRDKGFALELVGSAAPATLEALGCDFAGGIKAGTRGDVHDCTVGTRDIGGGDFAGVNTDGAATIRRVFVRVSASTDFLVVGSGGTLVDDISASADNAGITGCEALPSYKPTERYTALVTGALPEGPGFYKLEGGVLASYALPDPTRLVPGTPLELFNGNPGLATITATSGNFRITGPATAGSVTIAAGLSLRVIADGALYYVMR